MSGMCYTPKDSVEFQMAVAGCIILSLSEGDLKSTTRVTRSTLEMEEMDS